MRRWKQFAWWLATQDVASTGCLEEISRIGLTPLELPDGQWPRKAGYLAMEIALKVSDIDAQRRCCILGSRKSLLAVDRCHRRNEIICAFRRLSERQRKSCIAVISASPCPPR